MVVGSYDIWGLAKQGLAIRILFHSDNAGPHTVFQMLAKIEELDWMKSIDETDTQLRHGAVRLPFVPVNGSLPSG